jgi:hypothetical protein
VRTTTHSEADWIARNLKEKIMVRALKRQHRRRWDYTMGTSGLWRLAKCVRTSEQAADEEVLPILRAKEGHTADMMEARSAILRD